jgi:hypothetical protein
MKENPSGPPDLFVLMIKKLLLILTKRSSYPACDVDSKNGSACIFSMSMMNFQKSLFIPTDHVKIHTHRTPLIEGLM